jgi:hypothetical protein
MTDPTQLLAAIGLTLLTWAGVMACLVGLGLLPQWVFGLRKQANGDWLFRAFWMGFATTIAFLQVWHLFAPVNGWATLSLTAAGALGLFLYRRCLLHWLVTAITKHRWTALFITLASVWLADRCLGTMDPNCDSMGYHLHVVHWLHSYAIVPGLGNLRSRLAFNNASLLWPAVLETGFWSGRSWHIANGVLLLALMWRGIASLASVAKPRGGGKPAHRFHRVFEAMMLAPLVSQAVSLLDLRISTVDTDATAAYACTAGAILMLRLFSQRAPGRALDYQLLAVAVLFSLTVSCKISLAVFCAAAWAIAFFWWWRLRSRAGGSGVAGRGAMACVIVAASALIIGGWLVRGAILSGYPLFPTRVLALDVDWRMPVPDVVETSRAIFQWAKGRPLFDKLWPNYPHWSLPWLLWQVTRSPELILAPALLAAAALIHLLRSRSHTRSAQARTAMLLALTAVPAIIFWITFAPEPRFGFVYFWIVAGAFVGACAASMTLSQWQRRRQAMVAVLVALALMPLAHRVAAYAYLHDAGSAAQTLFIGPGPDHGFHPIAPPPTRPDKTASGLEVERDAAAGVGYAPLFYVDAFNPGLNLRKPGNVSAGFAVTENKAPP